MPHKPKICEWDNLVARLEAIYASGWDMYGDEAYSLLSDGDTTLTFDDSVWGRVYRWLRDAFSTAEIDGPSTVRDELWRVTQEYTGETIAKLDSISVESFAYPLHERWGSPDYPENGGEGAEPTDPRELDDCCEEFWSGIDMEHVAQLYLQELLALARFAADMPPRMAGPDPVSGAVSYEWVARRKGVQKRTVQQWASDYKREHGQRAPWEIPPPSGRVRGRMIDWPIFLSMR